MQPSPCPAPTKIGVALVYWGRLGAGASLMSEIAAAMESDERFQLYASPSRQGELPAPLEADRLLAIDTFAGARAMVRRSIGLSRIVGDLVRRMKAAGIAIIVTIMPHVWGLALQHAAQRAGIRTILIVHDAEPHPGERRPLFDWLVRREIRGADRIATLSRHVADRLIVRGDADRARIVHLFHPTFRFGAPAPGGEPAASASRLLFFGRILPYKGVPTLLEAFRVLRAAGIDCTLRVVGRGEIDAPAALMRQPGLLIEQGWVPPDAIGDILGSADIMVLPYLEASQSGVIAAAYGAGLPVVVTPVGGLVEQVVDRVTGLIAHSATAPALADAIGVMIRNSELYATCRAGAARRAEAQAPEHFARALGDAIIALAEETSL